MRKKRTRVGAQRPPPRPTPGLGNLQLPRGRVLQRPRESRMAVLLDGSLPASGLGRFARSGKVRRSELPLGLATPRTCPCRIPPRKRPNWNENCSPGAVVWMLQIVGAVTRVSARQYVSIQRVIGVWNLSRETWKLRTATDWKWLAWWISHTMSKESFQITFHMPEQYTTHCDKSYMKCEERRPLSSKKLQASRVRITILWKQIHRPILGGTVDASPHRLSPYLWGQQCCRGQVSMLQFCLWWVSLCLSTRSLRPMWRSRDSYCSDI